MATATSNAGAISRARSSRSHAALAELLIALYSLQIARDRRVAQRSLYVQAWHLRQLLPR